VIAVHLLLFAGLVAVAASRWLPWAEWVYRSPQLGLAAWYAVLVSVVGSVAGAAGSLLLSWPATRDMVCSWWAWCVEGLRGGHGTLGRLVGWTALAVAVVVMVRASWAGWRAARAAAGRRREHAEALALIGRDDPRLGVRVVDHPRPAAYLLPGRGGAVVVTSGTLRELPAGQVAAVLAHERAHAHGRHHLLLDGVRLLAAAFPRVAVFGHALRQIDRLVELRADEVATTCGHSGLELARALVALAEAARRPPTPVPVPVPVGAMAVTGGDALERVHRLLRPPAPLPRTTRLALTAGLVGLAAAPVGLLALAAVFPALGACVPMG